MLIDAFGTTIDKNLSKNQKKIQQGIDKYIDRNSDILYTLDLSQRNSFAEADRSVIYDNIGVTSAQAKAEITKSGQICNANKIQSNPFYCISVVTASRLLKAKNEKLAKHIFHYMSLNMYPSVHYGSFPYGLNKNIMDYTIMNLDSSFKIKSMSSIYQFLADNSDTCFETYKDMIVKCTDSDIGYVVLALHSRIKNKIIKIANQYYDNHKSGKYLNYDTDSYDEEDFHIMDNTSYAIDRLATKVYIKLLNKQFDSKYIKYAITRADMSEEKFTNILEDIISDDDNGEIKEVITSMIEYYLLSSKRPPDTICKGEFISYMKQAYASNAKIPQMEKIKVTIDSWLNKNMYKYGKMKYGTTQKLLYKKAIYMFLVFIINAEAR